MERVVDEIGAGATVPAGDAGALTEAVRGLLGDETRRRAACEAGRRWARQRRWRHVARPLLDFVEAPRRDPHRDRFAVLAPEASAAREPWQRRLKRRLFGLGDGR